MTVPKQHVEFYSARSPRRPLSVFAIVLRQWGDVYKKLVDACAMLAKKSASVFVKLAPAWLTVCAIVSNGAANGFVTAVKRRLTAYAAVSPRRRTAANPLPPDAPSAARLAVN